MSKFHEIKVGDKAELEHLITQDDIDKFVELTGDDNKIHVDKSFASRTSFKKPVAHGMLGASFISTVIGTKLPGDGAMWYAQNIEFLRPVRIGDKIIVKAEVIKKIDSQNILELRTDIYNQHDQKVTSGTAKVKVTEQVKKDEDEKSGPVKKTALVIGGSGGIGEATCIQLASDGFDVAVHYHKNKDKAEDIKNRIEKLGRKAIAITSDITNHGQAKSMVADVERKLGPITALALSISPRVTDIKYMSMKWDDIQEHLDLNIKAVFNVIQNVAPSMEANKYGKIITITSQAVETPSAGMTHYITAKAALAGFSRGLAMDLAPKGIRVNMVSPGMTDTELIADFPEKVVLLTKAKAPLHKLASSEDIANAISFLASEKSDYLTGETIRVNGGQAMI